MLSQPPFAKTLVYNLVQKQQCKIRNKPQLVTQIPKRKICEDNFLSKKMETRSGDHYSLDKKIDKSLKHIEFLCGERNI